MDGSLLDEMTGDPTSIKWRRLPVTVLQSLISLLAGAVVGPEGALGRFAGMITEWYIERVHVPTALRGRLVFAAASAAYNGLLANPLFTAVPGADAARRSSVICEHRLPPGTRRTYDEFRTCPDCGRAYWRGAHHTRLRVPRGSRTESRDLMLARGDDVLMHLGMML